MHLNFLPLRQDIPFSDDPSEEELTYRDELLLWQTEETGYHAIQGTKPQTLAYALTDSPAGLAAWIVEKFQTWTDHRGDFEGWIDRDSLLTNIALYWLTGAINSSFWPYYAIRHDPWPLPSDPSDADRLCVLPSRDAPSSAVVRRAAVRHPALDRDAARGSLRRLRGARPARRRDRRVLPTAAAMTAVGTSDDVRALRARYVPRGVSTTDLVVACARGASVWDPEGAEYLDFAGGIACQNLGHAPTAVVEAIRDQADRYLHQCFMVGMYEPYVELCRRLDGLARRLRDEDPSRQLRRRGGRECRQGRPRRHRQAGRGRLRRRLPRTHQSDYGDDCEARLQARRRPARHPGIPRPRSVPVPRGHGEGGAAWLDLLFAQDVAPEDVACVVLEPVQGEGGFVPMPPEFLAAVKERCERHGILYVDDEVQAGCGRTGTVWAIERLGIEPDLLVAGKTLGGGLPLAAVTGRAEVMDAVSPGGLGGTFGGNPLSCAAALAVLDGLSSAEFRGRAGVVEQTMRRRLEELAAGQPAIGEVRGLGAMLAVELVERTPTLARETVVAALERGLLLLACGLDGNVIRLLPPITIETAELERGLMLLGESLLDAVRRLDARSSGARSR